MFVLVSTVSIWSLFHVLFSFAFTHSKVHVAGARDAIVRCADASGTGCDAKGHKASGTIDRMQLLVNKLVVQSML